MQNKPQNAFTLIELLVVIAIIGILSSVVLASLSGARESAQVTRMVSDINQLETSLTLWMQSTGRTQWPTESQIGYGNMQGMAANTNFGDYISSVPDAPLGNGTYIYENDGQSYSFSCSGNTYPQITIYINGFDSETAQKVDEVIDDGDLGCGRMYLRGDNLMYLLSKSSSF